MRSTGETQIFHVGYRSTVSRLYFALLSFCCSQALQYCKARKTSKLEEMGAGNGLINSLLI